MNDIITFIKQFGFALFFCTIPISAQTITWQQLSGPHGGTALSFASKGNGDIFAGSDYNQKGVYRSTDGGLLWQPKSQGIALTDRQVDWMLVDDSSYIIIGTNSHIGSKIYKSTDNGENWFETENLGGSSCAVNDSGHIYVGNTGYAQYSVSRDGGYSWTHYTHPSPFINCVAINDSGHVFIGGNYTGYRSTDQGASWATLPLPDGINSMAVAPNGSVFAGCSREYASTSGVYRSTDNGDSWTAVKEGFRVYASQNIVVNQNGDILVGSWGWGIWKSTDNGDTWAQQNAGLGHFYVRSMHMVQNGDVYAGLSGGGVYRSTDAGTTWTQVGLPVAGVSGIAINSADDVFTSVSGISRSTDLGATWMPANIGLVSYDVRALIVKKSNGYLFAGTNDSPDGTVFRSTDNGGNWVRVDDFPAGIAINGLAVGLNGEIIATATGYSTICQKSTDDGMTWEDIKNGQDIGCGKVAFNSAGDLFSASWGGGLWKLPDGDTAWIDLTSNYGYSWIPSLFIAGNDYIYAGGGRSTDHGLTWTTMSLNQGYTAFAENSIGHIFCGTTNFGSGVWRSTDYGDTWEQVNSGLPTMDVRSVAVDSEDYLYAGPWGYPLFRTTTSTTTDVNDILSVPVSFELHQNYPNPFNPSTTISYQLPFQSHVTLKVIDVLGREVATLVDGMEQPGRQSVNFDASRLSSGVYYYRITARDYIETKKLVLIR